MPKEKKPTLKEMIELLNNQINKIEKRLKKVEEVSHKQGVLAENKQHVDEMMFCKTTPINRAIF
ncbi:MAG: DUF5320 domain-containing protein [Patescibacteria group bacterium]